MPESSLPQIDLSVQIGSLKLRNPILVASGTFGYGREMAGAVDYSRLGGLIPKTITLHPRIGNAPPRSVETPCGMLNSIGLDNDGLEHFLAHHLPYLRTLPTALIVNVAGNLRRSLPSWRNGCRLNQVLPPSS
jgi:dihydroorotate dehydrogenase (NAD+) catalytic subunit